MSDNKNSWQKHLHAPVSILSEDIPDIELYMDQITRLMDTRLSSCRRYPEDKILTKTMINNYTKNRLLPPSVKKKYSKEHLYMLIFIYHLKHLLSISDIQTLLEPISDDYFYRDPESGVTLKEIYDKTIALCEERFPDIEEEISQVYDKTLESCRDCLEADDQEDYLGTLFFVYQLCYDIYVRKMLIERLIDDYRDQHQTDRKRKK